MLSGEYITGVIDFVPPTNCGIYSYARISHGFLVGYAFSWCIVHDYSRFLRRIWPQRQQEMFDLILGGFSTGDRFQI